MSNPPHILVFPYPAQGHMLPLLDLTHHLALQSLTITIILTPKNHPILKPLLSTHPTTIQTLILPFPPHPKIPPGVENIREIGNIGNYPFIKTLSNLKTPIIQWFKTHPNPPIAIISDFFLGWTHQLATQLSIPRLVFYPSTAFLPTVVNYCWKNINTLQTQKTDVVEFHCLHKTVSFRQEHLPSLVRRYRESDPESEFVRESFIANNESWGFIFNSFEGLDGSYLDQTRVGLTDKKRVFTVGPLVSNRVGEDPNCGSRSGSGSGFGVMKWLDGWEKDEGSVVYVCFGSQKLLKKEQMEALAFGLERSMTRFVWVVKEPTGTQVEEGYGLVPDGFEDRVSGRGIVVRGWAPQVGILSHLAVGGFLSHCGWNSVLEAVVAGVAILAWPMEADQFINARLVVEDTGVAVRICEGVDSVPNPDELGRVIERVMSGDSVQKTRAKEMKEEAAGAVSKGGGSYKELGELVKAFHQLNVKEG